MTLFSISTQIPGLSPKTSRGMNNYDDKTRHCSLSEVKMGKLLAKADRTSEGKDCITDEGIRQS
jgi:hypothetical protein